jgi:5-methylcytosine-specific restriction endonuclease McrA
MQATLLLNASYEPLRIISWKKALTLLFSGKVEVIDEYESEVHSISFSVKLPSICRLIKYVRVKNRHRVKFSRANIYARDNYSCQYCGRRFPTEDLTFDHVVPVARGGVKKWDNIVTACFRCNHKKGGRTPAEAGMDLIREPVEPQWLPAHHITFRIKSPPDSWRDYLYWNVELDI